MFSVKLNFVAITKTATKVILNLGCYSNQLTSLDVSNNMELKALICEVNPMTSLDLSKNRKLKSLSMIYMDIATIDVSNCGDEEK